MRIFWLGWRTLAGIATVLIALLFIGPTLGALSPLIEVNIGVSAQIMEPRFEGNTIRVGVKVLNWWIFDIHQLHLEISLVDPRGTVAAGSKEVNVPSMSQAILLIEIPLSQEQMLRLANPFFVDAKARINYFLNMILLDIEIRGRFF